MIQNKLKNELIWSVLNKITTLLLFLAINIIIARSFGVELFGKWSFFLSILNIILVFTYFGLNQSIQKFNAQHNETDKLISYMENGLFLRIVISLGYIIFIILILGFLYYFNIFNEISLLLFYSIPLIFFSGIVEYIKYNFSGLHVLKNNFIVNLSEYGIKLFILFLLFLVEESIEIIIFSFTIGLVITSIIGAFIGKKYIPNFSFKYDKIKIKELLNSSYFFLIINLGFIIITEIDVIMLGFFSNAVDVAMYSIAKQIITYLPHITIAITMGIMPIFAKLNSENKEKLLRKFKYILKINAYLFSFIVFFIILVGDTLILYVFGEKYLLARFPLYILSIYLFLFSSSIILNSFLDYTGNNKKRAIYTLYLILLIIIFNVILIPKYGAIGAAIGTVIAYIPYFILIVNQTKKVINKTI